MKRRVLKWSDMVSDLRHELPALPPAFVWERDYAGLWEGRNEGHLNDILFRPGPDDVITIDGFRAPFREHLARVARKGTMQ